MKLCFNKKIEAELFILYLKEDLIMKKIKKIIALALIVGVFTAGVLGCGAKEVASTDNSNKSHIEQIKESGKLLLSTGDYRPFEYHDEKTNEIVGYDIDLAQKIADKLGVKLEVTDMQFTSIIPTVQNGQADLAIAAMYITDERKATVDFADPYLSSGVIICVKKGSDIKGKDDLIHKKVGAKLGGTSAAVIQKMIDNGANIELVTYKQNEDMLVDLENGRVDAGVNDLLYQLQYNKEHSNLTILDEMLATADLGIAVKKGDTEFIALINEVLKEMKDNGELDKLYKKWIPKNNV